MLPKRGAPKRSSTLVGSGANDRPARTSPLTCPRHQQFWKVLWHRDFRSKSVDKKSSPRGRKRSRSRSRSHSRSVSADRDKKKSRRSDDGAADRGANGNDSRNGSEREDDWKKGQISKRLIRMPNKTLSSREIANEYGQFTCEALNNNNKKEFIFSIPKLLLILMFL